jgi:hypothetical protein
MSVSKKFLFYRIECEFLELLKDMDLGKGADKNDI